MYFLCNPFPGQIPTDYSGIQESPRQCDQALPEGQGLPPASVCPVCMSQTSRANPQWLPHSAEYEWVSGLPLPTACWFTKTDASGKSSALCPLK